MLEMLMIPNKQILSCVNLPSVMLHLLGVNTFLAMLTPKRSVISLAQYLHLALKFSAGMVSGTL